MRQWWLVAAILLMCAACDGSLFMAEHLKPETKFMSQSDAEHILTKRSIVNHSTTFPLNDSHNQLVMYWVGEDSDVVICFTRDREQLHNSTSDIYVSLNYGTNYTKKTPLFKMKDGKIAIISKFLGHPKFHTHFVFLDEVNKYILTTKDTLKTVQAYSVDFTPSEVSFDPQDEDTFLVHDTSTFRTRMLWGTKNFGKDFTLIENDVKSFEWDSSTNPATLYIHRAEPEGEMAVFANDHPFSFITGRIVITHVQDFQVVDDFMFATKKVNLLGSNGTHLQLWVSYKRGPFRRALFPSGETHNEYYVADVSDGQVFLCVEQDNHVTDLYISNSPGNGDLKFAKSLERIVYYNPKTSVRLPWFEGLNKRVVELHRVGGIRGVYIASQLKEDHHPSYLFFKPYSVATVITFDQGGEWKLLKSPSVDHEGNPVICKWSSNCTIHLHQSLLSLVPGMGAATIVTSSSYPGLILASGTIDARSIGVSTHTRLFLSRDAGYSWHIVLDGNYFYQAGDYGNVIIAVKQFKDGATNEFLYSKDVGMSWERETFSEHPVKVYALMTEPGGNTTVFTLFGSLKGHHQWLLVKINLTTIFERKCTKDDYKLWSPGYEVGHGCLLGRIQTYEQRWINASCYSGFDYKRHIVERNCLCSREDFECDFGFEDDGFKMNHRSCIHNPAHTATFDPYAVPKHCKAGTMYNRTRGYRKIAGDICEGGEEDRFAPQQIACPIREEEEFIVVGWNRGILRINIDDSQKKESIALPEEASTRILAVEYDFKHNCLFWADNSHDKIYRMCLDGNSTLEVLIESDLNSTEGLAFDWASQNLYFVDGVLAKIEVIRTDVNHEGRMRRTILNSTVLHNPRGIAVHPVKGYMFWTDWSPVKPCVGRATMDGRKHKCLLDGSKVRWPNGIAIDFISNKLFVADANLNFIASMDFDGNDFRQILHGKDEVAHPFGIGVYKDWVFWNDWTTRSVYRADKNSGLGITTLASNIEELMGLTVFAHSYQQGNNSCSSEEGKGKCTFLCIEQPEYNHLCLCPDGLKAEKDKDGNETCFCPGPDKKVPFNNGACQYSNCPEQYLSCGDGLCIPELWKCDGMEDCISGVDEKECTFHKCQESQFQCKNGYSCIPSRWKCDFAEDCEDGSDELNCTRGTCHHDQFQCKNGQCISKKWRCDMQEDCKDGSDEMDCSHRNESSCENWQFNCNDNGTEFCIPNGWLCDGENDCKNGLDEHNCPTKDCETFSCDNSHKCIPEEWKCDGENDCSDGSDESNCSTIVPDGIDIDTYLTCSFDTFNCSNGRCIDVQWVCDGVDDCGDSSDEAGCGVTSPAERATTAHPQCPLNHFQCPTGRCIWSSWVCDGMDDCVDGADEADEECHGKIGCFEHEFRCKMSGGCVPKSKQCDGNNDCADKTDELGCHPEAPTPAPEWKCSRGQFPCKSTCIPLSQRCDGKYQCSDESDEQNCTNESKVYQVLHYTLVKSLRDSLMLSWVPYPSPDNVELRYKTSISQPGKYLWTNSTWIDKPVFTFLNLSAHTDYNITVYVKVNDSEHVFPPAVYIRYTTQAAEPSAPYNVTATQLGMSEVRVTWQAPRHPRGHVSRYLINVSPPSLQFFSSKTSVVIIHTFELNTTYSFEVVALNTKYHLRSDPSKTVRLTWKRTINKVSIVKKETEVELKWDESQDDTLKVSLKSDNVYEDDHVVNTTGNSVKVTGLAPGTTYEVSIIRLDNAPLYTMSFETKGDKLPSLESQYYNYKINEDGTVTLKWRKPEGDKNWHYAVYYAHSWTKLIERGAHKMTKNNEVTLKNLAPCKRYMFAVLVKHGDSVGPGPRRPFTLMTPGRVTLAPYKPKIKNTGEPYNELYINLMWNISCSLLHMSLRYEIEIVELTRNKTSYIVTKESKSATQTKSLFVHEGGRYRFRVRSNIKNSEWSPPRFYNAPAQRAPQLNMYRLKNGSLELQWNMEQTDNRIKNKSSPKFMLWVSEDAMNFSTAKKYVVGRPPINLDFLPDEPRYVAITALDQDGYHSKISSPLIAQATATSTSLDTGSVVGIVVPVLLVLAALSAALAYFVVRHRRLRRTVDALTAPSYAASATFSTAADGLDDEDSPMIRGFSDDEPLVIA